MSEHCPGCRHSDPTEQGVDPLGVMNPSHGTMSKTAPHIALEQLRALRAQIWSKLPTPAEQRRADRTLRRMLRLTRPKK